MSDISTAVAIDMVFGLVAVTGIVGLVALALYVKARRLI